MKKKLLPFIQLTVGISIIAFIFISMKNKGDLGKIISAFKLAMNNWSFLLYGISIFSGCLLLCTLRWNLLLKAQGLNLPFHRVLILYFIGHFFNSFLFGVTGGDVVKACYVAKETNRNKTQIISTVFIDRIIGLLALIAFSVFVMIIKLNFFLSYKATKFAIIFNVILLFVVTGGLFIVFRQNLFEKLAFFRRLEKKTFLGEMIHKVYDAFHTSLTSSSLLLKTLLLSFANHITIIIMTCFLGKAIGIKLKIIDYFTVFPTINAIAGIPITPGGMGTRESATIFLLGVFNVPDTSAFTLSIMVYSSMLLWSLVGGIVYILGSFSSDS